MRVEVLAGVERRRRWSFEEKARIVEASYAANTSVSALARRYGIALGLLFTWRRQAREGRLGGAEQAPVFVPVVTKPEPDPGPCGANPAGIGRCRPASASPPPRRCDRDRSRRWPASQGRSGRRRRGAAPGAVDVLERR